MVLWCDDELDQSYITNPRGTVVVYIDVFGAFLVRHVSGIVTVLGKGFEAVCPLSRELVESSP